MTRCDERDVDHQKMSSVVLPALRQHVRSNYGIKAEILVLGQFTTAGELYEAELVLGQFH